MGGFFKMFFASLLALIIFSVIGFFLFLVLIAGLAKSDAPLVEKNSVLVINIGQSFQEQKQESPLATFSSNDELSVPGVYDVVRLIQKATKDEKIKGIYLQSGINPNGFATSEEIRNALLAFKRSGKFIIAYSEMMNQKSYHIANVANKVYVNPKGFFDWAGFSSELLFLKGTLEKLDIEPQIFYAGKFKSATEPLRTDKMTPENRLQTSVWLGDLYAHFLLKTSEERKIDTATLHQYANEGAIKTPQDAVDKKLIDGVRYDDQIKDEIKEKLKLGKYDKINFISINSYFKSGSYKKTSGEKIALIYAEGNIVDGGGEQQGQIASADYIKLVRKARLDKTIKAIVFRVNSGGGSALASETIWRELSLAKAEKPVVVSFGDVAASGGYYISCGADSIFASPTTITGSIGVFGIIPNMEGFFKNKLGVTFDGVKTAPYADLGAIYRPMNENEKKFVQQSIDEIYVSFKQRVADGRKKSVDYVDSIAQGRVWSGNRAIGIGLIDKFGGLQDAVDCAARMAKVSDYHLREYPETQTIFDRLFGAKDNTLKTEMIRKELGEDQFKIYNEMMRIKQMTNSVQTRLPFEFFIN
ncbi:MAG: signal peptide peptidase SppA [Bacteroidetes bacterium]|nr:MAG: signal peptide peptidase SppA [Bacteroidota bacterium]